MADLKISQRVEEALWHTLGCLAHLEKEEHSKQKRRMGYDMIMSNNMNKVIGGAVFAYVKRRRNANFHSFLSSMTMRKRSCST